MIPLNTSGNVMQNKGRTWSFGKTDTEMPKEDGKDDTEEQLDSPCNL
jgi:hypothetical protein